MFRRFGGIDQHSGDLAVDRSSASEINNVDLHPVGEVHTRKGMAAVTASPGGSGSIFGLAFLDAVAARYMYAAKGAALYRTSDAAAWTWATARTWTNAITKARTVTASYGSAVERAGENAHPDARGTAAYLATGTNLPWVDWGTGGEEMQAAKIDAVAANRRAGYPASTTGGGEWRDWAANPPSGFCLVGRGTTEQIFAWGFANDLNRIDYSALQYPWNFSTYSLDPAVPGDGIVDGGWFYALADEADVVIGVIQHMSRIIVFKRRSTLVYSGYPGVDMQLENIYPVGCTSYESVVRTGTNLLWWSEQGPVSLYGVQEFGDLAYANIGQAAKDEVANLLSSDAANVHCVHDRENYRVVWFIRRSTDQESQAVCYYYDAPQRWSLFTGKFCGVTASVSSDGLGSTRPEMYGAYRDGTLCVMFSGDLDIADPIESSYTTAWQAVEETDLRKRLMYVEVMLGDDGAIEMGIDVGWDYSESFRSVGNIVRTLGEIAGVWDTAVWGGEDDMDAYLGSPPLGYTIPEGLGYWSKTTKMVVRYSATGTGFMFRIQFSSSGSYPMHLAGWRPYMEEKGMR